MLLVCSYAPAAYAGAELEQAEEILNGRAGAAFVGPAGRQEDQRNRIKDLAKKITNMYNTRDAQMAAINGSSAAWEHAFERRMQRLTESVKDTVDDSKTLRLRAKQRISRVKDRLSSVLVAANSLNSLRSKIEAVAAKTETVYTRTASDYGKVGVKSGKVQADITSWRVQLQVLFPLLACALPSPTLSPTDPAPRGLLTLWARALAHRVRRPRGTGSVVLCESTR